MLIALLIRHGESQANAGLATPGPEIVELTEKGRDQASAIAKYLKEALFLPDLIITSPYLRAKQTALVVHEYFIESGYPPLSKEEWPVHEFTYLSSWHHITSTLADRREAVKNFWQRADPTYVDGLKSESFEQFIGRVYGFKTRLESIVLETIVIFSHEQFITAFLWLLQQGRIDLNSKAMKDFRTVVRDNPLPNGSIVRIEFDREHNHWSFETIIDHLSEVGDELFQGSDIESSLLAW